MKKQKTFYTDVVLSLLIAGAVFLLGFVLFSDFVPALKEQYVSAAKPTVPIINPSPVAMQESIKPVLETPSVKTVSPPPAEQPADAHLLCGKENNSKPTTSKECREPNQSKKAPHPESEVRIAPPLSKSETQTELAEEQNNITESVKNTLKNLLND